MNGFYSNRLKSITKNLSIVLMGLVILAMFSLTGHAADPPEIPAKGMVTMIDLGADKCIPCKMMAPILEKVKTDYTGKALIHFYDVWKDREPAARYKIRAIPTQIFFDKEGKETYRHEGFMSEADIVSMLKKLGVK